ncbi:MULTISPECIES: HAD family hydrolase [Kitasatospora]|uniref:HAD family hydrolase n=1 Tax=Kitasatospora TaxID=2063 RepID=UPI0009D9745B|nr:MULTISPECIES: HAD family hydrolase [Kitasatospora]
MTSRQTRPRLTGAERSALWAPVRGVCFDLGGTLLVTDTHPTTGQVAHVLGITLEEAREVMKGRAKRRRVTPADLAGELARDFGRPEAFEPLHRVLEGARTRAASPQLFPDALAALQLLRARGFALFAMTNSLGCSIPDPEPGFHALLDAVVHSADTGFCKPEPGAFAAVEAISGLDPHQLLHVGDSALADAAGAVAAGWHAAYLHRPGDTRLPQPAEPPTVTIRTLRTLRHLLPAGS